MSRLDYVNGGWHVHEFQMNLKKITKNLFNNYSKSFLQPSKSIFNYALLSYERLK